MKKIITVFLSVLIIFGTTAIAYAANYADGTYSVPVILTGGTGRVTVQSPTTLTISNGKLSGKVVLTSTNYTRMKVNGVTYNNENEGGNSTFTIPVSALDTPLSVSAETTAMSEPHFIDYKITFSSTGVASKDSGSQNNTGQNAAKPSSNTNKNNDSKSADTQKEELPETPLDEEVIEVTNTYSKSTSVSAELLAGYQGKTMNLSTLNGKVIFDEKATEQIAQKAKGSITLTMDNLTEQEEYKDKGYDLVVDLFIMDEGDNNLYADSNGGKASVTLNYDKEVKDKENLKVYRLSDGSEDEIEAVYNAEEKTISFDTEHFSVYAVKQQSENHVGTILAIAAGTIVVVGAILVFLMKKKGDKEEQA